MSNEVKAFRASDNFNYKMKLIEEILKQNNIELNKTELFDEMIDLYYVHLVSGDDVLAKQVHILCADWVCRVNRQTAVFHNSILEEIRKELKVLEDSIESLENKIL